MSKICQFTWVHVNVESLFNQLYFFIVGNENLRHIYHNLIKQERFIEELVSLVKLVAKETGNRTKKTEKFQKLLFESDVFKINFTNFDPIPFPLDPEVQITKIVPAKTSLFKSALMPAKYDSYIIYYVMYNLQCIYNIQCIIYIIYYYYYIIYMLYNSKTIVCH